MKQHFFFLALVTVFSIHLPLPAQENRTGSILTTEQSMRVKIIGGYGNVFLRACGNDQAFTIEERGNSNDPTFHASYKLRGEAGILVIRLAKDDDIDALSCLLSTKKEKTWMIELTDRVPMDLDVSLGAGEADLDLTGLRLRNLKLETGAGTTSIRVDEPNRERIKSVVLSAGVGTCRTQGLGNLQFESLNFDGGIGTYILDCSGALLNESRLNADIGLGSLVIFLPDGIGARAHCDDSWFSSTSLNNFKKKKGSKYETVNYETVGTRLNMDINSGIGSVDVQWKK